jgi:hypothetical protein
MRLTKNLSCKKPNMQPAMLEEIPKAAVELHHE